MSYVRLQIRAVCVWSIATDSETIPFVGPRLVRFFLLQPQLLLKGHREKGILDGPGKC